MTRSIISKRRRQRLRGKARAFSWANEFAPTVDFPAISDIPKIKPGARGRRKLSIGVLDKFTEFSHDFMAEGRGEHD